MSDADPYLRLRSLLAEAPYAGMTAEAAEVALNAATVAAPGPAELPLDDFVARFTPAEFVAAEDSADPVVRQMMFRLRVMRGALNMASATARGELAHMASIGLLTAERAAAIGAAPAPDMITPREQIRWPQDRIWAADVIAARAMEG